VGDQPNMLGHARFYAGAGIPVFPTTERKLPLTGEGGFHHATTDRDQLERWWEKWPVAGIRTPAFDVVDVDLYKPACPPTWQRIRPLIPERTPRNKTPRGGEQYFFSPGTLRKGKIGPGIDSRYAGANYVLLPPSRFVWQDEEGAQHEGHYQTVVDLLSHKPKPAPNFPLEANGGGTAAEIVKQIATGGPVAEDRNTSAFWYAVRILQASPADIPIEAVRELVQVWVDTHCVGNLAEVDVGKQVRGAAKFVAEHARPSTGHSGFDLGHLSSIEAHSITFRDKPLLQADAAT
jgi:hypothetical protein